MNTNPRIPADEHEVFAMAFMIGYLGDIPDELQASFPGPTDWTICPDFIPSDIANWWRIGYDCGVAFFSDHSWGWEE